MRGSGPGVLGDEVPDDRFLSQTPTASGV